MVVLETGLDLATSKLVCVHHSRFIFDLLTGFVYWWLTGAVSGSLHSILVWVSLLGSNGDPAMICFIGSFMGSINRICRCYCRRWLLAFGGGGEWQSLRWLWLDSVGEKRVEPIPRSGSICVCWIQLNSWVSLNYLRRHPQGCRRSSSSDKGRVVVLLQIFPYDGCDYGQSFQSSSSAPEEGSYLVHGLGLEIMFNLMLFITGKGWYVDLLLCWWLVHSP